MSQKTITATVLIVVLIALGAGAYAVAHSNMQTGTTANSSTAYSTPKASSNGTKPQQNITGHIGNVLLVKTDPNLGSYVATPSSMALYTYGADTSGTSNCTGECLANWPAYQDTGATTGLPANVGTIKRTDNGQTQFTYKGMPLYTFVSDDTGQVTGNNVDNFQIAKP